MKNSEVLLTSWINREWYREKSRSDTQKKTIKLYRVKINRLESKSFVEKYNSIDGKNPFDSGVLKQWTKQYEKHLPSLSYVDIYNYIIIYIMYLVY